MGRYAVCLTCGALNIGEGLSVNGLFFPESWPAYSGRVDRGDRFGARFSFVYQEYTAF